MLNLKAQGLSSKTIYTYLAQIKAALNYGAKPRIIFDSKGIEREGKMLNAPFHVETNMEEVCRITASLDHGRGARSHQTNSLGRS
jgi:hypothetical protein